MLDKLNLCKLKCEISMQITVNFTLLVLLLVLLSDLLGIKFLALNLRNQCL